MSRAFGLRTPDFRLVVLIALLLGVALVSCASGPKPAATPASQASQAGGKAAGGAEATSETSEPETSAWSNRPNAQVVVYAREAQPSGLPIKWVIRKIAFNKADGTQLALPGGEVTIAASSLQMGADGVEIQRLVTITDVPGGDYTGVTFFTRGVYLEDTGEALPIEATFVAAAFPFSVVAGVAKTIVAVVDLAPPGASRVGFKFQPQITIETEPASPKGKLVLVANEASSNLSVIDRSTERVVKNVFLATRPAATGADQRRNRLYIADQKAGVLYEMDMMNQHLLKATQLEFVDEPVHIEPIPSKDLLIVVNFGSDTVYLVDAFNLQIIGTLEVGDGPVNAAYSVFAERAFVVNMLDGTLSVINIEATPATVDTTLQIELRPTGITIDDSMGWLYVTNSGSPDLTVLKVEPKFQTIAIERSIPIGIGAADIILDPYGRRLFVAMTVTNEILCVDPYTGVTIYSVRLPAKPEKLMFDPDEKKLYATVPSRNAVVVIDTITREIKNWIETGEHPVSIEMRS
jgi:YVTN family beta-propeller protein